jgi:hypothetical protein
MPPYRQIAAIIKRGIESGQYPPNTRIPTESELVETYEVCGDADGVGGDLDGLNGDVTDLQSGDISSVQTDLSNVSGDLSTLQGLGAAPGTPSSTGRRCWTQGTDQCCERHLLGQRARTENQH